MRTHIVFTKAYHIGIMCISYIGVSLYNHIARARSPNHNCWDPIPNVATTRYPTILPGPGIQSYCRDHVPNQIVRNRYVDNGTMMVTMTIAIRIADLVA